MESPHARTLFRQNDRQGLTHGEHLLAGETKRYNFTPCGMSRITSAAGCRGSSVGELVSTQTTLAHTAYLVIGERKSLHVAALLTFDRTKPHALVECRGEHAASYRFTPRNTGFAYFKGRLPLSLCTDRASLSGSSRYPGMRFRLDRDRCIPHSTDWSRRAGFRPTGEPRRITVEPSITR